MNVSKREGMLASKYISNPHLINGFKYDLRVYVCVTSFNPLKVYIYNDGLVRFATEKYSNDVRTITKKYMHLTNFAINKRNPKFIKNNDKKARQKLQKRSKSKYGGGVGVPSSANATQDDDNRNSDLSGSSDDEPEPAANDGTNSSKWDFGMLKDAFEKMGLNYNYV